MIIINKIIVFIIVILKIPERIQAVYLAQDSNPEPLHVEQENAYSSNSLTTCVYVSVFSSTYIIITSIYSLDNTQFHYFRRVIVC